MLQHEYVCADEEKIKYANCKDVNQIFEIKLKVIFNMLLLKALHDNTKSTVFIHTVTSSNISEHRFHKLCTKDRLTHRLKDKTYNGVFLFPHKSKVLYNSCEIKENVYFAETIIAVKKSKIKSKTLCHVGVEVR